MKIVKRKIKMEKSSLAKKSYDFEVYILSSNYLT
jgi:hypothetical protein